MDKELFYEYDEGKGIGDLLFVNTNKVNYYRFYRKRHEWDDCYMIEFSIDSDEYFMYWGGYDDHINRNMVCSFDILLPSDPKGEWRQVKFESLLAYNLPQILESVECYIYSCESCKHLFSSFDEEPECPKCEGTTEKWDFTCAECRTKMLYKCNYVSDYYTA